MLKYIACLINLLNVEDIFQIKNNISIEFMYVGMADHNHWGRCLTLVKKKRVISA
jgi:hypothetical protein